MSPKFAPAPEIKPETSRFGAFLNDYPPSADPALLALLAAGIAGLIAAAALVIAWRRRTRRRALPSAPMAGPWRQGGAVPRAGCRWKTDRRRMKGAFTRWVCTDCGVEAFTTDDRPPKECKRALRDPAL